MQFMVTETRGLRIENLHSITVAQDQDPVTTESQSVFIRSCAKPFQALPLFYERPAIPIEALAIACASHSGTPRHQHWVNYLLTRAELNVDALQCGCHPPLDKTTRHALIREGLLPSALHHNCSGKHAGMLLACQIHAWSTQDYRDPSHPLQQSIFADLSRWSGMSLIETAVDGCGAPTFYLPLASLARLYLQLATAEELRPIYRVMTEQPDLVGGQGRLDTEMMKTTRGRLVVKVGADGLVAVGNALLAKGLALKVWSGRNDIRDIVFIDYLKRLGWLTKYEHLALSQRWSLVRRNAMGGITGEIVYDL